MKTLHCCSDCSKYNVPVAKIAKPGMAAALKHNLILFEILENKEI
jgi:hypothetical protein